MAKCRDGDLRPLTFSTRILNVAGESWTPDQDKKVRVFLSLLLIHLVARAWISFLKFHAVGADATVYMVVATLLTISAVGVLAGYQMRAALVLAAVAQIGMLVSIFPQISNHGFIEGYCIVLVASFDLSKKEDRGMLLDVLRWSVAIIFFHTGLQKLWYGTYFDGQFLAYQVALSDRFADFFQYFLPAEEFERIRALRYTWPDEGPFAVSSPLFLVMSNAVWIFELFAPVFMLWRRTRVVAITAAILFTLGIQFGAHEIMFGLLFTNLAFLFYPAAINRFLIIPMLLAYAYFVLVAARLETFSWLLPETFFN